jgi:hypothetical protein
LGYDLGSTTQENTRMGWFRLEYGKAIGIWRASLSHFLDLLSFIMMIMTLGRRLEQDMEHYMAC